MDLPERITSTKMSSPLPSMQRRPTLKWVCHSTLLYLYTNIKIHSSPEKYAFNKRKCITRQDCVLKIVWKMNTIKACTRKEFLSENLTFVVNGLLWHSLTIHDQRSANTRSEKPRIREERAKIGPVASIKLAFMLSKTINLKTYARHFEEKCCNYI